MMHNGIEYPEVSDCEQTNDALQAMAKPRVYVNKQEITEAKRNNEYISSQMKPVIDSIGVMQRDYGVKGSIIVYSDYGKTKSLSITMAQAEAIMQILLQEPSS